MIRNIYDTKNIHIDERVYMCRYTYHPKKDGDQEFEVNGSGVRFNAGLNVVDLQHVDEFAGVPFTQGPVLSD